MASIFASPLIAQQTLGSVNGTVADTSGAAIPGSTVTVSDAAINVTRTTHSLANGSFQVFNLPPGTYQVQVTHDGFESMQVAGIEVQEAQAKTIGVKLKVGEIATSVEVTADTLLNATDSTNGYTLDSEQIATTPLATGSFTQLAVLSPGVNAELLSSLDSNAGLGNQNIWANGQRATSNTFQFNGVDTSNIFSGMSSSNMASQRWNFNIGEGAKIGGASQTSTSSFGSIGNSLPSAPPEFLQEMRVSTSSYDAQQGATSGAQIDINTLSGTNNFHGQVYGSFANNSMNAAPFFYKQDALLAQEGVGAFPMSLANPALHRWTTGATLGGPILKDKLFFFVGFQHMYVSDQSTAISQLNVPSGLTDDRSAAGINAALTSWNGGTPISNVTMNPIAMNLLQTQLPNGQYLIPSAQTSAPYAYGVPNVTLVGTSVMTGNQANASLDYDLSHTDRLSFKYYYQNDPTTKPFGVSETGGFPSSQNNSSQVGVIDNTISIGSRINWEQRIGYSRMGNYSYFTQAFGDPNSAYGTNFGIGGTTAPGYMNTNTMPGLSITDFAANTSVAPMLTMGPNSAFNNTGFYQNRLNPSTNLILSLGQHTLSFGGGYSYTQLNIENDRTGIATVKSTSFENFLKGVTKGSTLLDTIDPATGQNDADRYYRSNEFDGYAQDQWKARNDLTITAGVRYDYHGGLTEKYGNMFNFDPSAYNVTGNDTTGFDVINSGFVVAGNNKTNPSAGVSNSTLSGRQWGFSPRVGFAFAPSRDDGKFVISGGAGIYYDRGELFSYLSQPAGSGTGGPFGVTESSPLGSYVTGPTATLGNPFGSALPLTGTSAPPLPNSNPATMVAALQSQLNGMLAPTKYGPVCSGPQTEYYSVACPAPLNFGAYDKNNVLPYVINMNFKVQWQPSNDTAITIGYAGNRGRHSVIPMPFNEAQIATPSSPAMIAGATPHSGGETDTYGVEVLNQNSTDSYGDYLPIKSEPWNTYDGGNVDFRVPYVGYNPNAVLYETVGNSAYDALQTHIEKRLSHNYQLGASYTWSHSLDEQSDLGLFFTGNNPADLRSSWASSDFDRTHVFSGNFLAQLPNFAQKNSWLSYVTNDWNMTGIGILQSGQPFSLYEYDGAVGSAYVGNYPSLMNPVLGVKNPSQVRSALTGNKGDLRGAGGNYIPMIDPTQLSLNYLAPGQKGVPTAAMGNPTDPLDTYETDFATGNQRNIFREAMQKRLDLSFRKTVKIKDRVSIQYALNVFNVTNTTSLDVPQNETTIRQAQYACSTTAYANTKGDCYEGDLYGQVASSPADQATNNGRGSAGLALDKLPYVNGTGSGITLPTTLPVGQGSCQASTLSTGGCPNNGANFGSVTGTIGGSRAFTMGLHITY